MTHAPSAQIRKRAIRPINFLMALLVILFGTGIGILFYGHFVGKSEIPRWLMQERDQAEKNATEEQRRTLEAAYYMRTHRPATLPTPSFTAPPVSLPKDFPSDIPIFADSIPYYMETDSYGTCCDYFHPGGIRPKR